MRQVYAALERASFQYIHRFAPRDLSVLVQTLVEAGVVSQTLLSAAGAFIVPQV